ncbi:hypothetical protein BDV93DRAFT_522592 [Ceratobasidium sp. AG-I]|nr:hypothetical protein BDV93DRAFT_522592 [Ceratobasidium sp. AG-I]
MLLTMLAALAPNAAHANSTLAAERASCAIPDMLRSINIHDTNGPVTLNIYCSPSQLPPSNTQLNGHIIAVVVITTLLAYQFLCAASRWSSDHTSTLTHVQRDIPAGCNGAVSEAPRARKISLPEQQALLFDKELASKSATPREPLFPVESARPNPQTFSTVWVKSDPSHDVARSYALRANRQHGHESAISATSDTQRALSPGDDYHRAPQISAGDTPAPRNVETTPDNDDRTPPLPQASTSHSVPGTDPSLLKSFNGSTAPYIISSFVVLAIGSDWAGTKWHLPGVAFDIGWLGRIFSVVGSIFTLHTFPASTPVTLEQVHSKVLEMFEKASPGAAITGARISELILRIGTAANPVLKEMQATAQRIKMHKTYRMVDDEGRFILSTLWMIRLSILVSIPNLILASVLSFFAPTEPESAAGSVPAAAGLPGETNLFQPAGLLVGRGAMATTAECLAPPLPV